MIKLNAELLNTDPRVIQAKQLLLQAVEEHQKQITGIKPADPDHVQNYESLIATYSELRGGKLWYPYLGSGIGRGPLVELLDGSIKYDFISGIGPHIFGHNHKLLIEASIEGALKDTIMQGHLQQNGESVKLSELLIKTSKMDHCFLSTSGAMANENALKIAFQKNYPAHRILAFERCFAGRSITLSQITDKPGFREGLPTILPVDYIPFGPLEQSVHALKSHIQRYPKGHAAFILELVQGEAGFYHETTEFYRALMEICREHGITIIADEVQTFGRTYELFAHHYFKLHDLVDIVTVGKISQVCATLFKNNCKPHPGLLSQTFTASTSAILAAQVIIETLLHGKYYGENGKIKQLHEHFKAKLEAIHKRHPSLINGPYGIGGMIAFTPYDGNYQTVFDFTHRLFHAGVIGFVAGAKPTRVRFLPPVGAMTTDDIDAAVEIIEKTLLEK